MKIAMVGEGTYPFSHGGVSVWCDQMVRGMPDLTFDLTSLVALGNEPLAWDLPHNVDRVTAVPLWGGRPRLRRVRGPVTEQAFTACLALIDVLTMPTDHQSAHRMAVALHRWATLARTHDLEEVLVHDVCLEHLQDGWRRFGPSLNQPWPHPPQLSDAIEALRFLTHSLRPLSFEPPHADVVHLVANGLSGLVGLSAKWRYGTPYVLSEHGVYLRERYLALQDADSWPLKVLALKFMGLLTSLVYRNADLVAPGNVYNRRWEIRQGAADEAIRTVYNGVDPEAFGAAGPPPSEPTVSWVGRVDPLKDLETLIRGFALAVAEMPHARLRLFGGTPRGNEPYRDRMIALTHELGIAGNVTFEGRVEVIQDAYAAGSLVALTSISEGFPYTVIEAMSCARATVSTDVGGVAEAVGDAGLIVPPRDPAALSVALLKVLRDDALRDSLAMGARSRVLQMFTLERSLGIFRSIYGEFGQGRPDGLPGHTEDIRLPEAAA